MARPGPLGKALVDSASSPPTTCGSASTSRSPRSSTPSCCSRARALLAGRRRGRPTCTAPSVSTQALLMDGIRRIDELSLFQARIPGPAAYLRRSAPPRAVTPQAGGAAAPGAGRRPAHRGRRWPARPTSASSTPPRSSTTSPRPATSRPPSEPPRPPPPSRPGADRGPRHRLRRAAPAGGRRRPRRRPARLPGRRRRHLRDPSAPFAPLFRGLGPGAGRRARPGAAASSTSRGSSRQPPEGEAPRLLAGGLRELLFFYLFLAGERIPREADEAAAAAPVRRKLTALEGLAGP